MAISVVMPGHSRPRDGVLSHTYVPGIHVFGLCRKIKTWMAPEVGLARLPRHLTAQVG
jgi:hypothetical protein